MRTVFAALLLSMASALHAAPPPDWTIQPLGTLGSEGSFAMGLNNRGDVAGSSSVDIPAPFGGNYFHGFVWGNGAMVDAGTPSGRPDDFSELVAINDRGLAIGLSGGHAYAYQDGVWTPLGFLGEPAEVNKSGTIVGSTFTSTGYQGWVYRDGNLQWVGTLGGRDSQATAINDRGLVVGNAMVAGDIQHQHAFAWQDGVMVDLGTLGGAWSLATDVNSHGVIVGQSATATGQVAFIFDVTMRPLIDMTTNAHPGAINDRGAVVGTLDNNSASFLYEDGVLTVLEQIPEVQAAGWTRLYPTEINDRGWITGWGRRAGPTVNEAFVLIPH